MEFFNGIYFSRGKRERRNLEKRNLKNLKNL